jgi:hypothetical protein
MSNPTARSLIRELLTDKPPVPKIDRPRPVRQSLQPFLASHPNEWAALERNALAYERSQREASRARTFKPTYQQPNAERKVA